MSLALREAVYRQTADFPREEVYGLVTQIRRAAVSVPSNIAEGAARNSTRELLHFLGIACGSLAELDTQMDLAVRLGYVKHNSEAIGRMSRVGRVVRLLRRSIQRRLHQST